MKPFVLLCFVLLACMFMVPTGGAVLANISDCQQGAEITVMVGGLKDAEVSANIFKWQDGLRVDWSRT